MKAEVDKYVIQKVKERRLELGYSQEALSYAIDKSTSFIANMENGSAFYNIKHLNQIADILKCSPRDFLPEKPIKPFIPTEEKV